MITVSVTSSRKKESPDAKIRIRIIGFLNWESRSVRVSDRFFGLRILDPYLLRRSRTYELFSPLFVTWSFFNISDVGILQNSSIFSLFTNRLSPYCHYYQFCKIRLTPCPFSFTTTNRIYLF